MKLTSIAAAIVLMATVAAAQTTEEVPADAVAVVNGEVITAAKLDALYQNLSPQIRSQYEQTGGKRTYLENYIAKRLLLQEAARNGFDKRPEVQQVLAAAVESALFDRYVRDVVASEIVTDAAVREFYEKNVDDFVVGDRVKVRHIAIGTTNHTLAEAQRIARQALAELRAAGDNAPAVFASVARKYSEDATSANGGDLGWMDRHRLDKTFADAAFALRPGTVSDLVQTQFGFHVILVDDVRHGGVQPFEEARRDIREYLLSQKQQEIVNAVTDKTNALRRDGDVDVFPSRID